MELFDTIMSAGCCCCCSQILGRKFSCGRLLMEFLDPVSAIFFS
jgi:hypothetical protein